MPSDAIVTDGGQRTLTGDEMEAERAVCEYVPGCERDATHVATLLDMEIGEQIDVKVCGSCRSEVLETNDSDDVRKLRHAEKWDEPEPEAETVWVVATNYADDPHPHIEGVFSDKDAAQELMEQCADRFTAPHPVAWQLIEQEVEE